MAISEKLVNTGFEYAKEVYAAKGVDVEEAMKKASETTVSVNCWFSFTLLSMPSSPMFAFRFTMPSMYSGSLELRIYSTL